MSDFVVYAIHGGITLLIYACPCVIEHDKVVRDAVSLARAEAQRTAMLNEIDKLKKMKK